MRAFDAVAARGRAVAEAAEKVVETYGARNIVLRVLSAAVLAPVAVTATVLGGPAFTALVAVVCLLMLYEWCRMVEGQDFGPAFIVHGLMAAPVFIFAASGQFETPVCAALLTPVIAASVSAGGAKRLWAAFASFYITLPSIALLWLRAQPDAGLALVLFLFVVIWATDTGAYAAGNLFKGPKFSPRISPNKTWAGVAGGVVFAVTIAAAFQAIAFPGLAVGWFLLAGLGLAVAGQAGDVFESVVKRLFGVKDTSALIPGHGGVLDRLDGFIFATGAAAIALILFKIFQTGAAV